jgi:uroporphyrin-III C-methyltransferase
VATAFTVISGHLHGESDEYDWHALAAAPTLVVLMGLGNLGSITERLIAAGKPKDTPAAVIQSGTGEDQRVVTAPLDGIVEAAAALEPPATIVIGPVVALSEQIRWFREEPAVRSSLPTASR